MEACTEIGTEPIEIKRKKMLCASTCPAPGPQSGAGHGRRWPALFASSPNCQGAAAAGQGSRQM